MRKIILMCAAGMSTSLMVQKMQVAAKEEGYESEISAYPIASAKDHADADIILLGPQVGYQQATLKKVLPNVPVEKIDMRAYGMMDGKKVLAQVKKVLGD